MAMIDEWGEEIQDIQDEGVFDTTSLGQTRVVPATPPPGPGEPVFPATTSRQFPYAPVPEQPIGPAVAPQRAAVRIGESNRYGLVEGGGMGDDMVFTMDEVRAGQTGSLPGWGAGTPSWDLPESSPGMTATQWGGFATTLLGGAMDAVGQGIQMGQQSQVHQMNMQQASQQLDQQMQLFQAQLAQGQGDPAALAQAERARSSNDVAEMMAAMAALQGQRRTPAWVWVAGGVAVLAVVGGLVVFATKGGDKV
jgi:hypothetical protein